MSGYNLSTGAPGLLRIEALNMTVSFQRTSETTGIVSWNIPTPATGCAAGTQAYNGILITLDTTPSNIEKSPVGGSGCGGSCPPSGSSQQVYIADPTADPNLFTGSMIGTAFVIGAFYNDLTTVSLTVTGLMPNTAYYVTGFPVDAQLNYFYEGVHAYSLTYENDKVKATHGRYVVQLGGGSNSTIATPTTFTGLSPGIPYDFYVNLGAISVEYFLNGYDLMTRGKTFHITINGTDAQTYQDLVNQINIQFAKQSPCPQGPQPPNAGGYYWDVQTQQLYLWNGYTNTLLATIIDATQPNLLTVGSTWYDPATNVLKTWNGIAWVITPFITYPTPPTQPVCDSTVWFDTSNNTAYRWNGITWCQTTVYVTGTDPSQPIVIACGSYWWNTSTDQMFKWDDALDMWVVVMPIISAADPTTIAGSSGPLYWVNPTTNVAYCWNVPSNGWNVIGGVVVSTTQPATPIVGNYWYNPSTMILAQFNGSTYVDLYAFIYTSDPSIRNSCDIWWNTTTNAVFVWNIETSMWVPATTFYQQATDPMTPPAMTDGTLWFNTTTGIMQQWKNQCWVTIPIIQYPGTPTAAFPSGINTLTAQVWYSGTAWYYFNSPNWIPFAPVVTTSDPSVLPAGTYWFNSTNMQLSQWNGVAWMTLLYSLTSYVPVLNQCWMNTTTNTIMTWNGTTWVLGRPIATVELDPAGNLLFTNTLLGSNSTIVINNYANNPVVNSTDPGYGTLFNALSAYRNNTITFGPQVVGQDGNDGTPSYERLGVGTNGSMAERLRMSNEIRQALGNPSVTVQLTPEQLDLCITKSLEIIRQKSGIAYKAGYFFLKINPEQQKYRLSNCTRKEETIIQVMSAFRLTSSFLSSAMGAGVYGQIVLQHLYNMGTFDLLSYHIMADYIKELEILFASRLTYTFNEDTRELHFHNRFPFGEVVLLEATVERTEQNIMKDRYIRPWLRRWATAEARLMLAEVRGAYSNLPGAGGSVTMNATDLRQAAQQEFELLTKEIEDFLADNPEEYGVYGQLTFG